MWKMRGVYSSFSVHSFDTLTDLLVIYDWWFKENKTNSITNINSRFMAYNAIGVLIAYRIISSISIWIKYHDVRRSVLQLLDVLIFQEIYYCHLRIVDEINNKIKKTQNSGNTPDDKFTVDATMCFKYVRNMEAIFESMPQSVLQLVYAMRTSTVEIIYVLSVLQSIVSMTNSIINNDYTHMTLPAFKSYKKKFPPSFQFLQHFVVRTSEVIYRIGLLSLLWNVCEGLWFGVFVSYELVMLVGLMAVNKFWTEQDDTYSNLAVFQTIIVMPSEFMFDDTRQGMEPLTEICCFGNHDFRLLRGVNNIFCCYWTGAILSTLWRPFGVVAPSFRIGFSFMELLFVILYAILYNEEERLPFLVSGDHGLYVFITTLICFSIYSQYQSFFPHISLPNDIDPLSRYGAAFNGELEELKKIGSSNWEDRKRGCCGLGDQDPTGKSKDEFWSKPDKNGVPCIVYALSNEQFHVVEWLTREGSVLGASLVNDKDVHGARKIVGSKHWEA
eukprot:156752_1